MEEPKSILEGVTEHDVVTVHNPLSDTFTATIGRSVVVRPNRLAQQTGNPYADKLMSDITTGIDGGGHQAMVQTQQKLPLKPGETMRMPGDVARVVVRQIVKEMMQRLGAKKQMADPHFIMEYEKRVVLNHESMLTNLSVENAEDRFKRQLDELNKTDEIEVAHDEQPFPTENAGAAGVSAGNDTKSRKAVGRSPGRPATQTS